MSNNTIQTVGFFGCGAMAEVVAEHMLPQGAEVMGFDPNKMAHLRENERSVNIIPIRPLGEVANADLIVLAVPARETESALFAFCDGSRRIADWQNPQIIMDVSSVKKFTGGWFKRIVSDWGDTLLTHPLFGPQSVGEGIAGKDIIVTGQDGDKADALLDTWQTMGANIVRMSADEHDKQMTTVQAIPFAIAQAFNGMGLTGGELESIGIHPDNPLLNMANVARNHSWPLTETMLGFNPHAHEALVTLLTAFQEVCTKTRVTGEELPLAIGKAVSKLDLPASQFATPTSKELGFLVDQAVQSPDFPKSMFGTQDRIPMRFLQSLRNVLRQFRSAEEMVKLEEQIMEDFQD